MNLVLIDFNEQALKATADACRASGSKVVELAVDVTKLETWTRGEGNAGRLRQDPHQLCGRRVEVAPIEEMDDAINQRIMDLNLTSAIMSCRTFTPPVQQQGYGKIINVSSVSDRRSWPGWSVYAAAKAAVNAFTRCLYTELRPHGIAVGLLVPGGSNTGFQAAAAGVGKLMGGTASLPRALRRHGLPVRPFQGRLRRR